MSISKTRSSKQLQVQLTQTTVLCQKTLKGINFFFPLDFEKVLTQNCSPIRNISQYGMEKHEADLMELFLLQELWHSAIQRFYCLLGCVRGSGPCGHLELGHHRKLVGRCRNMSSRVSVTNATFMQQFKRQIKGCCNL